jgi:hypothetical protein
MNDEAVEAAGKRKPAPRGRYEPPVDPELEKEEAMERYRNQPKTRRK